ncbi:hypothetical protein OAN22_01245 [Alphaproteobacteria bacterium]|nr:hypothetical protein [Alphaproteobacteria bacterium]
MMKIKMTPLTHIEAFVLMDNVSDPFTKTHKGMRWNELEYRFGVRGKDNMCGADMCRA